MTKHEHIDPRQPHRFRDVDGGLAAVMSGSAFESNQANLIGGTTAFLRSTRCGVPGCEKPRQDPIHAAREDESGTD
jgi:hypothetical protein